MKLIKPSYEILTNINSKKILESIEIAGRTCYKSEDKITKTSAKKFIEMILKRGHESVIEHQSITVKFICDRGVSHEIVRHRLCSFSQESTRYCNYSKDKFGEEITFILPLWLHDGDQILNKRIDKSNYHTFIHGGNDLIYLFALLECEQRYLQLINGGWQPQQARSVLPNSLKTEIVVTANLREWREIFRQRTAKVAHPQMRELMCPLLDELKEKLPIIFNDINYEDN